MSRRSLILLAVIAAAEMGLCVSRAAAQTAAGQTLRIQEYPGSILNLPHWVMADGGFCAKQGIKCEMVPIPSGPVALQALAGGSLEVSWASTEVTMQSASRGNDVQIIAGNAPNNFFELNVRSDVPLPNKAAGYPAVMKDIAGLKIGVTARGSGVELFTRALLIGAGLSPDSVTYVAVGSPATAYPTLIAKQIDAATMFQPFRALCAAQKTCVVAVDMPAGEGPPEIKALNGAFGTYIARRDYIKANPGNIAAFQRALTDAVAWLQDSSKFDEVMKIARKRMTLGDIPNAEAVSLQLVKGQIPKFGVKVDRAAVNAFSDFLMKNKLIEKPVSAATFVYEKAP